MSFIQNLSVFIGRIHRDDANVDFIAKIFYEQEIASVRRIDFIECRDKGTERVYYQAKLYFHFWFKNQTAYNVQRRIIDGTHARVVYEDPWYWVLLKNKNPMTEMELVINERLDALAANAIQTNRYMNRMRQQMSDLQTAMQAAEDRIAQMKKQEIKPNTHIRFCYFEEPANAEKENLEMDKIKSLCAAADAAEKTATKCAEQVLHEEDVDEWDDYYDEVDRYYNEQVHYENTQWNNTVQQIPQWNCLPTSLRERNCNGCYLLDQGMGGENQEGHSCLDPNDDFEIM